MIRTLRAILDTILMIIAPDERGSYFIKKEHPRGQNPHTGEEP